MLNYNPTPKVSESLGIQKMSNYDNIPYFMNAQACNTHNAIVLYIFSCVFVGFILDFSPPNFTKILPSVIPALMIISSKKMV